MILSAVKALAEPSLCHHLGAEGPQAHMHDLCSHLYEVQDVKLIVELYEKMELYKHEIHKLGMIWSTESRHDCTQNRLQDFVPVRLQHMRHSHSCTFDVLPKGPAAM